MSIKKHIPNTITCCNLISGCFAVLTGTADDLRIPLGFIILGAVFDFFDGFTARLLKVSSPIGKELDSLADCITFGFAPAVIVSTLLSHAIGTDDSFLPEWGQVTAYGAFIIAAFSALRLAKFNLDTRQSLGFLGMPTPANALFWGSLAVWMQQNYWTESHNNPIIFAALLVGVVLCCWLLVSEVPMFALKFKQFGWKGNEIKYIFILLSALLLIFLKWGGFAAIILLYVIVSVLTQKKA